MESSRKAIVVCLSGYFGDATAKKYENLIFAMVLSDASPSNEMYAKLAYEKTGQLVENCEDANIVKKILKDIKGGIKGWDCCVYEVQKANYEKELVQANQKPKAVKGMYVCKPPAGCGSDEFYIWSLQTRSGDEGATIFRSCSKCGKRNKEN